MNSENDYELEIGKNYFVRTVSDHWIGKLVAIKGPYTVVLENPAWIADTGRFHVFLRDGKADNMEIEPTLVPKMVQWLDISPWKHGLFNKAVPS